MRKARHLQQYTGSRQHAVVELTVDPGTTAHVAVTTGVDLPAVIHHELLSLRLILHVYAIVWCVINTGELLRVSEANEVPISSYIWVASTINSHLWVSSIIYQMCPLHEIDEPMYQNLHCIRRSHTFRKRVEDHIHIFGTAVLQT